MERKYYVKFPSEDIHSGHFSGEVSIYKDFIMSMKFSTAKLLFQTNERIWKIDRVFRETFHGLKITNYHYIIHFFCTFWKSWAFWKSCSYLRFNLLHTWLIVKEARNLSKVFKSDLCILKPYQELPWISVTIHPRTLLIKSFDFYNSSVEYHSRFTNESLIRYTSLSTTECAMSGKCKDTWRFLLKTSCFMALPFLPLHLVDITQKRKIFGITCI